MRSVTPLPASGEVFVDERGSGRALRVSWHPEAGVVVLSVWRERECVSSFRLSADDVPVLVEVLRAGLHAAYDQLRPAAGA